VVGVGDEVRLRCEGDGGCSGDLRADVAEEVQAGSEGKAVGVAAEEADGMGAAVVEGWSAGWGGGRSAGVWECVGVLSCVSVVVGSVAV